MSLKRGQISIFVLISLVILIGFSFVFYLNNPEEEKVQQKTSKELSASYDSIKLFVDLCLKDTAEKGIYAIGLQGGYYYNDSLRQENPFIKIPYYWHEQKDLMPSIEVVQKQLAEYVESSFPKCINDFENLKTQGYEFKLGVIEASTIIGNYDVVVNIDYPIDASIGNEKISLNKFSSKIDFNFMEKYHFARKIIDEQKKTPNSVPLSFISRLAYDNNFTFGNTYMGNDLVLYTLVFEQQFKPAFVYNFVNSYNWAKQ